MAGVSRFCASRSLRKDLFLLTFIKSSKICRRGNYIVLLPEVPPDTPETNPLLRDDNVPDFTKVTPNNYVNAVLKLAVQFDCGLSKIEEQIEVMKKPLNVDDIVGQVEVLSAPLSYTFSSMVVYSKLMHNSKLNDSVRKIQGRYNQSVAGRFSSESIYNAMKEISQNKTLSESQRQVVNKYILESRLKGIELGSSEKEHFDYAITNLAKNTEMFRKKLTISSAKFKHTLSHPSMVQNFPSHLVKKMASHPSRPTQGPWNVTLDPTVSRGFLENCSDRILRWNVWQASVSQASNIDSQLNNSIHIEEIRSNRKDIANLLGYKSYAELSMETKMAGSVDTVKSLITSLHVKNRPAIEKELLDLQDFALQNGFNGQLELWDVPFWRNQQKKDLCGLDEYEISQYFPLDHVFNGLFTFCKNMFAIDIQECSSDSPLWHKDVKFYKIYDENGNFKGSFFVDAFQRPGLKSDGSWLDAVRSRSLVAGTSPLSYLILNFMPPISGQKAVLTFEEVVLLFKKFGHVLLSTLSEVPYGEVSGLNNLDWDVINVVPLLMSQWLTDYNTILKISRHTKSGEPLPKSIHDKIKKNQNHMAGYDLNNELYLSALDLELHMNKTFWLDIMRNLWKEYIPFQLDPKDSHPCSFKEIFFDMYPKNYYCSIWEKMIAADVFGAFHEVGLQNQTEVERVGKRFKDTFLALGGGCSSSEVFRRFRGRDPSLESLLISKGLKKSVHQP